MPEAACLQRLACSLRPAAVQPLPRMSYCRVVAPSQPRLLSRLAVPACTAGQTIESGFDAMPPCCLPQESKNAKATIRLPLRAAKSLTVSDGGMAASFLPGMSNFIGATSAALPRSVVSALPGVTTLSQRALFQAVLLLSKFMMKKLQLKFNGVWSIFRFVLLTNAWMMIIHFQSVIIHQKNKSKNVD